MNINIKLRSMFAVVVAIGIFVLVIGMQSVNAQGIGSGAGCTITSNPAVSSGEAVKLLYEADGRPNVITISATDNAAAPAGTPTLGAPDPSRVDGMAVGNIMTGPITKNTTFTMSVSNSAGGSNCKVKVYYKAKPAGGWQVPLVSQQSIYNRLQIPGGFDTTNGSMPFLTAYWVPGGYFVVNGRGNSGAGLNSVTPAPLRTPANRFESGGMYGFREDGTFIGARDVVYDTSARAAACFEGGGCYAGDIVSLVGQGKFIRDLDGGTFARSPILYSVSASGFNMDQRLFFNGDMHNSGQTFKHVAVAGGKMIGVSTINNNQSPTLEVYDMNFNKLASFSSIFYPIVGADDYIIGATRAPGYGGGAVSPITVYKMPSTDELSRGVAPFNTQTILGDRIILGHAIDASDSSRIGLLTIPKGSSPATATRSLVVFKAGASGLTQVIDRQLVNAHIIGTTASEFAISGDYLAYGNCSDSGAVWNGNSNRGGNRFDGCELVVEKISSGEKLATEPLPRSKYSDFGLTGLGALTGESQAVGAVAISPTGRIMVATGANGSSGGENGNIYLYQIGGATLPPGGDPAPFPPSGDPGDTPQIPGQMLSVTYGATSTTPSILTRFATFGSAGTNSFTLSIFGQNYTVDTSRARIVRNNWTAGALSDFTTGSYVNVFGALDLADAALIHAETVRNPMPAGVNNLSAPRGATLPSGVGNSAGTGLTGTAAVTNSALQNKLNALQESLKALQLRMNAR